jgi:hypothetical protein
MKNPNSKEKKKVDTKIQSIRDNFGLSTRDIVIKTNNGPQTHHSPQIAAGEATLK